MKFNPITNELFTNDGDFIKKLYCPYKIEWDDLTMLSDKVNRICNICDREIFDTENISDNEIKSIIGNSPNACLKVNFNQENLEIVYQNVLEKK